MKESGFTLLEILIAVVISSIAMTLIFSFFNQSLFIWERRDINSGWEQNWRVLETDLNRNLRNLFITSLMKKNFLKGKRERLELITLKDGSFSKVIYKFDQSKETLLLTIADLEGKEIKSLEFFKEFPIKDVAFNYYDPKGEYWKSEWSYEAENYLPTAVKLELKVDKIELPVIVIAIYLGREYQE